VLCVYLAYISHSYCRIPTTSTSPPARPANTPAAAASFTTSQSRKREGETEEEQLWEELVDLVCREGRLQGKYARLAVPRSEDGVALVLVEQEVLGQQMEELQEKVARVAGRRVVETAGCPLQCPGSVQCTVLYTARSTLYMYCTVYMYSTVLGVVPGTDLQ
jgi:hypothetical protein